MIRIRNKMNPSDERIVTRGAYNNLYRKMGFEEVIERNVSKQKTTNYETTTTNVEIKKSNDAKVESEPEKDKK